MVRIAVGGRPSLAVALLVLGGAGLAGPALAQQPRAGARFGDVRGVVFDSLIGAPLESARVFVRGNPRVALTDRGGRFHLDSVPPGTAVVAFEHDALDSAGLSAVARRVQVTAGRLTVVELGTPSQRTVRLGLCRGQGVTGSADSGIVHGSIRDAESGQRLAGALVRVSWVAVRREGPQGPVDILRPSMDVRTDSVGNYYACSVPPDIVITAQAFADSGRSGVTEALIGPRGVARHDLHVSRERVPGGARDSSGLWRGLATILGTVVLDNGQPRPSARVTVDDTDRELLTDQDGRFVLTNLPSGSHMVMARMVGFTAVRRLVHLRNRDTVRLVLTMRELTVLDTIRVTAGAERRSALFDELEQRLRTGGTSAVQQLSGERLRRLPTSRSIFQQFHSIRVEGRSQYNFQLFTGNYCPVRLYIDGTLGDVGMMQSYRPEQLAAVEFFPRGSQAPIWANVGDSSCGVALVWTRFMR